MSNNQHDNGKVTDMWNDFTEKMGELISTMSSESETHMQEIQTTWNNMSEKFGDTITDFLDGYNRNYTDVYDTWINETKTMGKRFGEVMKDFGTDYDNLYKMYFDRTASFQRNLMIFPYLRAQNLAQEVSDLKKKIEKIEKKLSD